MDGDDDDGGGGGGIPTSNTFCVFSSAKQDTLSLSCLMSLFFYCLLMLSLNQSTILLYSSSFFQFGKIVDADGATPPPTLLLLLLLLFVCVCVWQHSFGCMLYTTLCVCVCVCVGQKPTCIFRWLVLCMRPSSHHRHGTHGAYSKIEERERKGGGGGGSCSLRLIRHAKYLASKRVGMACLLLLLRTHTPKTLGERKKKKRRRRRLFSHVRQGLPLRRRVTAQALQSR